MSTVLTWRSDQFATIFIFRSKFFFQHLHFLRPKGQRFPHDALISLGPFSFLGRIFFSISRFLNVAQERVRCLRFSPGFLISFGLFSFFVRNFFFNISISEGRGVNASHAAP